MLKSVVIIPTYNEKDNIDNLLEGIFLAAPKTHVLFIDDNSPDGTGILLDERAAADDRIHVLHGTEKAGLGKAYVRGFRWALERDYDRVLEMDADLSHDPAALPDLIGGSEEADLVLGSRYQGGIRVINWPLNRLILSKGASYYVRLLTGLPITDPTGGFKCFRRSVLEEINLDTVTSSGYSFQIEMTHRAWLMGFKIKEVPITFVERQTGESKMNSAIIREALIIVWILVFKNRFRRRPVAAAHPRSVCV